MNKIRNTEEVARNFFKELTDMNAYTLADIGELMVSLMNAKFGVNHYEGAFNPDYYERQHKENKLFQQNNWLLEEVEEIKKPKRTPSWSLGAETRFLQRQSPPFVRKY